MAELLIIDPERRLEAAAPRWSAAVGARARHVDDLSNLWRPWREASAVLTSPQCLAELIELKLPRRDHVLVIGEPPPLNDALALGAIGVFSPGDDEAITAALTIAVDGRSEACIIGVSGATGGAGASTFAALLATLSVERKARTALVDGDRCGGGLDLAIGAERAEGARWRDLATVDGHIGVDLLDKVLPSHRGLSIVSFDRDDCQAPQARPIMTALARGFDTVVCDVRNEIDPFGAALLARSVATVVLVPTHLRALAAARQLVAKLLDLGTEPLVVTRSVRHGLGPDDVARVLGRTPLAAMRSDRRLPTALERGQSPPRRGAGGSAAKKVLDVLGVGGR